MTTLKELLIKYEYSTDIKFKTNDKFLVPLDHLEITSWGPMGDGARPKNKACYCLDCENSDIKYSHNWLKFKNGFADNEYTYPDILNLQVDINAFYVDALPANFKTSQKLSEKEIVDMFYHRIMEANEINQLEILSKVFGEYLPWDIDNVDEIATQLFLEEQEFITNFYDTLNNYLMEEKEHYNEVLQIFKKIRKDVGEILYKYLKKYAYKDVCDKESNTSELKIMLDDWRFTFTDFEDGLLMKTIDGKYYTHVGSKFKFILYLFDKGTYVNVQEKEESLLIKIYFSLSPNITSSVESNISILKETYELQATPYDQFEEGSVTDEDAIEINEPSLSDKEKLLKLLGDLYWLTDKVKIWDENNLAEGFKNLSDKHKKEIIKYVLHYPNDPDETGFYISEDEVNCLLKKLDENWESWDKSKKILSKNKIMNKNDDKFSNIKKIIGKVFGRYYMLYTAIIKWFDDTDFAELFAPSYLIANQLYNQEKEFITQFYDLFDQYLLNNENKGEENEEVKRFFTDIKRDIGSLLYHNLEKNAKIKKNSHELVIKIDGYDFLFTFLDGAISTLDKKWNLFYESNFIALRYLFFDDTINKVTINENELKINIIYDYDINETYILKKWYDGSSSVFSLKGELKELELENDYGNYYKFLQYLSLLNKTKSQKFVKPRQVAITCYYTKNESKYYNKTYLITIENYIDLVLKYFNKYLIHVEMRPEYVYNLFINEMSEYIKDVYFESIYEHIVEFLKRYSTLIEQEII